MKKNIIKILIVFGFLFLGTNSYTQTLKSVVPDNGQQGTNFIIHLNGSGTEWHVSPYFTAYVDSAGVLINEVAMLNDTVLIGHIYIGGNAKTTYRRVAVYDAFENLYDKDSAFKVNLAIPIAPVLLQPLNNAIDQPPNVTFKWDTNAYVVTYRIQIATDSQFIAGSVKYDTTITNYGFQIRPYVLLNGTKYYWRVNGTNSLGTSPWSAVWNFRINPVNYNTLSSSVPAEYRLYGNYPNPFNPSTNIKFNIKEPGFVRLNVFDALGREVETLLNQKMNSGQYEYKFDASYLPSGLYFYRLQAGAFTQTNRMMLLK